MAPSSGGSSVGRTQTVTVILDVVRAEAFSQFRVNNDKALVKLWYVAGAEQTGVHPLSFSAFAASGVYG